MTEEEEIKKIVDKMKTLGATLDEDSFVENEIWGYGDPQCCGPTGTFYYVFWEKDGMTHYSDNEDTVLRAFESALEELKDESGREKS